MDLEILPEPSDEERRAIAEALRLEAGEQRAPSPWQRAAFQFGEPRNDIRPKRRAVADR